MAGFDIHAVMGQLAHRRPIFHSEADFQFALAWRIKETLPDYEIRLEYEPFPTEPLELRGSYDLRWHDYSKLTGAGADGWFRYLAIEVG